MALFKISRGGENNLPTSITDGWAYFTPDTKNFFIDVKGTVGNQEFDERIQINEKPIKLQALLTSAGWDTTTKQQIVNVDSKITGMWYVLEVNPIAETFAAMSTVAKSNISYDLAGSTVIFTYSGEQPAVDIQMDMIFTPKERRIEQFTLMQNGTSFSQIPSLYFYDGCTWDEWRVHGILLNGLYAIEKKSDTKIKIFETLSRFFEIEIIDNGPNCTIYTVTSASGFEN